MKQFEVEYLLSARDEASATFKKFGNEVEAVSAAYRKQQGEISRLSQFIREQRAEQRQQNFLFNEARNVVGTLTFATVALSEATGSTSKAVQDVNRALVAGYSAFQAANFAMSALKVSTGGVALAIQSVIGVGAGLLMFLEDSDEKTQKATESMKEYVSVHERVAKAVKEQSQAEFDLIEAFVLSAKLREEQSRFGIDRSAQLRALQKEMEKSMDFLGIKAPDPKKEIEEWWEKLQKEIAIINANKRNIAPIELPVALDVLPPPRDKLEKMWEFRDLMTEREIRDLAERAREEQRRMNELQRQFLSEIQQGFAALGQGLNSLGVRADSLVSKIILAIQYAIELAKLINAIGSDKGSESGSGLGDFLNLLGTLFGLIKIFGFHQGGVVPKAHHGLFIDAPPTKEFPILVRGGETIRTERQEAELQQRLNAGSVFIDLKWTVNAFDAQSVERYLRRPQIRSAFLEMIKSGINMGYV